MCFLWGTGDYLLCLRRDSWLLPSAPGHVASGSDHPPGPSCSYSGCAQVLLSQSRGQEGVIHSLDQELYTQRFCKAFTPPHSNIRFLPSAVSYLPLCLFVFHLLLLSLPPQQVDSFPFPGPCCTEVMEVFQCLLFPSPLPPPLPCASALLLPSTAPEWHSISCQYRSQYRPQSFLGLLSLCTVVPLQSRGPWTLPWCWMEAVGCYSSLYIAAKLRLCGKLNHLWMWKLISLSIASTKVIGTS